MVRLGTFRDDLWYRISVFPIRLPPLRERAEDIPALAAHFARRAGMRLGAGPLLPTPDDVRMLLDYDWPGNVRELAAVIERAAILGNGRCLELRASLGLSSPGLASRNAASRATEQSAAFPTLDQAMAEHIRGALRRTGGLIEGRRGAATLLGINPHTLRARMRKLGIQWSRYRGQPSEPE
jgi:transcriptional regulator with GAF, ATPase, and Fis domain